MLSMLCYTFCSTTFLFLFSSTSTKRRACPTQSRNGGLLPCRRRWKASRTIGDDSDSTKSSERPNFGPGLPGGLLNSTFRGLRISLRSGAGSLLNIRDVIEEIDSRV
ncbi:hypothetical protein V8E55_012189 [Tylopilus felleus]